jgi:hypothetical protein
MTMWEKDRPFVILLSFVFGLFPLSAFAEAEQTPEAGKEFHTTLFGEKIYVPSRDRRSVTAANFGLHWIPNGPSEREILPFGALYVWRNWDRTTGGSVESFPARSTVSITQLDSVRSPTGRSSLHSITLLWLSGNQSMWKDNVSANLN